MCHVFPSLGCSSKPPRILFNVLHQTISLIPTPSSFLRRHSPGTSPTEIKHFHQPGWQDHILFNNNSVKDCTCCLELPPLLCCGCCHIQAWRCRVPYSFLGLYVVCVHVCMWLYMYVFIYIFVEVLSRKSHYQNMRSISNKNFQANMFWSWKTKGKSDSV